MKYFAPGRAVPIVIVIQGANCNEEGAVRDSVPVVRIVLSVLHQLYTWTRNYTAIAPSVLSTTWQDFGSFIQGTCERRARNRDNCSEQLSR